MTYFSWTRDCVMPKPMYELETNGEPATTPAADISLGIMREHGSSVFFGLHM